eukprot:PhF_6_TR13934/c0_g1_i1/m.22408
MHPILSLFLVTLVTAQRLDVTSPPVPALPPIVQNSANCPLSILNGANEDCNAFRRTLARADPTTRPQSRLTWSTANNCLVHQTTCNVSHAAWGAQLEQVTYDFSNICMGRVELAIHYSYHIKDKTVQYNSDIHIVPGSLNYITLLEVRDNSGASQGEQLVSLDLFEKDASGKRLQFGYSNAKRVQDQSKSFSYESPATGMSSPVGTWIMLHSMFKYQQQTVDLFTYELQITKEGIVNQCPREAPQDDDDDKFNYTAIIVVSVLCVAVLLLCGAVCGVRAYYAKQNKILAANTITVHPAEELRVVRAADFIPGQAVVVQGTVIQMSEVHQQPAQMISS